MTVPIKKIGYLDFTNKLQLVSDDLFWHTGDNMIFTWWGAILVEANLEELKHLHRQLNFKIVDNLSDNQFIISLFCEPFNYTGARPIVEGVTPCVCSDAEVTELDLPWYHLSMNGPERHEFIDKVMAVFKDHKTYVLANIQTLECLEIKTSENLKK
jgi:hypothetical protein